MKPQGPVNITAAAIEKMTGRCVLHDCPLHMAGDMEDADTPLDLWLCSGLRADPEYAGIIEQAYRRPRNHGHFSSPLTQQEHEKLREIDKRCRDSWEFAIPAPA